MAVLLFAIAASNARATSDVPCHPPRAATMFIAFSGSESACSRTYPYCTRGDVVTFKVESFGYDFRCHPHSFAWSFSDGFTATGREVRRVITSPHPLDVAVVVATPLGSVRLTQRVEIDVIIEHWPMIVERLSRTRYRFTTSWPGDITWDFGDGTTATGPGVVHEYGDLPRTYIVTVRNGVLVHEQPLHVPGQRRRAARH